MTSDLSDSLWHDTCQEQVVAAELHGEIETDLVVIGGGYTGLSAALQAATDGARTCLIEAAEFGHGGSGRNVGLANAGLWLPPEDINTRLGEEAGNRLSRILSAAPELVFDLIQEFHIACEPVRTGTMHCAHSPAGMRDLETRHRQLSTQGAPVQLLSREEAVARVGSKQVFGALFDPRAGTIQPLAYAKGLARAAIERGAQLFQNTPAVAAKREGTGWCVTTPKGKIIAARLILATNGYGVPIKGVTEPSFVPVHYFQAATQPLPDDVLAEILPNQEGCWDTATVMSSWRRDLSGRLIIGGMGNLGHIAQAAHRNWLNRKLTKMFPSLADAELKQTWFGRIAMTAEYLPKIQALDPTALVCFGYSGRGIGPGTVFGQSMARALLQGSFSDLPIAPITDHSLPAARLRQAYYETGATLTHLVKDRF